MCIRDRLHDLAVWLTEARCPHYFVNNCNLVDSSFNMEMIQSRLTSTSKSWLSSWFVNNYIRKCSQLCPYNVSRLFDDVSTTIKLQNAVSAIVDWRLNSTLSDTWKVFDFAQYNITAHISEYSLTVRLLQYLMTEMREISTIFPVYILSVAFLHVACRMSISGLSDELMDVLAVLVGQSLGPRRYSIRRNSVST